MLPSQEWKVASVVLQPFRSHPSKYPPSFPFCCHLHTSAANLQLLSVWHFQCCARKSGSHLSGELSLHPFWAMAPVSLQSCADIHFLFDRIL